MVSRVGSQICRTWVGLGMLLTCAFCAQAASGPVVTAMFPAPGSTLTSAPSEILVTLSSAVDTATVNSLTVKLIRSGTDGIYGTADDMAVTPSSISILNQNQIKIYLTGMVLPSDQYRVNFLSRPTATNTNVNKVLSLETYDYITRELTPSLSITGPLTAEAWFNFETGGTDNPRIVGRTDLVWEIFTFGTGSSRTIGAGLNTSTKKYDLQTTRTFAAGGWHHAAITYDSANFSLFIDGSLEAQVPATGQVVNNSFALSVGHKPGGANRDNFKGQIDECRVWNVAQSQAQIRANMLRALSGAETGLVVYWPFDELDGQSVTDLSPNQNHGTLGLNSSVEAEDPTRAVSAAPFFYAIKDLNGALLDGEYPGNGAESSGFPSGDGNAGGDFVAQFEVALPALVVHYPFNEGTGTVANDASGNGNNGTLTNGPTFNTGVHGNALSFDGVNDFVNNTSFTWPTGGGPVTVAFWNFVSSVPGITTCAFGVGTNGGLNGRQMQAHVPNSDQLIYWDYGNNIGNGRLTVSYAAYLNKWTHVALVSSGVGGNFKAIYLDGQLAASGNVSDGPNIALAGLHVGHAFTDAIGTAHHKGNIDDFRIYNRVLAYSDIQTLAYKGPIANNDTFSVPTNQTFNMSAPGVLANDSDSLGGTLSAVRDTDVSHGTLTLNSNGSFVYTPVGGFTGLDSFTYHVVNLSNQQSSEVVTVAFVVGDIPGLVAHYRFDEGTGTIANDTSGLGNHGTLMGGTVPITGVINGALQFNGTNGYVRVLNSPNLSGGSITAAAWIHRGNSGNKKFISKWNDNTASYQIDFQVFSDSKLWFQVQDGANVGKIFRGSTLIDINKWYHVTAVANSVTKTVNLYVNGNQDTLQSADVWDGTVRSLNMELNIGRKASGNDYWMGKLDDVRLYNRALDLAEVQIISQAPPPISVAENYIAPISGQLSVPSPGVIKNDSDPRGLTLTAIKDSDVSQGSLTLNSNGSFVYTPTPGYTGPDTFTYHAVNSNNQSSNTVTVTINVESLSVTVISPISGTMGQQLANVLVSGSGFKQNGVPMGATAFNGHYYLYVATQTSWLDAQNYCVSRGGHLVTITSQAENDFVKNLASGGDKWIGLTDSQNEGTFKWITGETVTYTNWLGGEPNDCCGGQDLGHQYPDGRWDDAGTIDFYGLVCEFEGPPTAVKLKRGANEIFGTNVRVNSSSQLLADFNLSGAVPGAWDVVVSDLETGAIVTLSSGFSISAASTTTVAGSPAFVTYRSTAQNIALNATVTPQFSALNEGTVTFQLKNGNAPIGNAVTSGTVTNNTTGNVTYSVPAGTAAGTYTLSATYNGTATYTGSSDTSKQLTINKAFLTVTAANASRAYGALNPVFTGTLSGVQPGDGITAAYNSSTSVLSNVGNYPVVPTLDDPNNKLGNYTVTLIDGILTVTKAPLSAAAFNAARSFGAANPVFSGILSGVLNGDNILGIYSSAATPASPVGNYAIVPSLLDPDGRSSNYTVTLSNGTLTIGKAALSVAAQSVARMYGAPNPDLTGAIVGIQNNDNISATYATSATAASLVGTYAILTTVVDTDNKIGNYTVTLTNGTMTVTPAPLTVTASDATRTLGESNPPLIGSIAGLQNNDNIIANYSTSANAESAIGNYPIVPSLSDPDNKLTNYTVFLTSGTLSITPPIPPIITSSLNSTVMQNESFTYLIFAVGSAPIMFTAEGLPAGLTLSGNQISGNATAAGVFNVVLTAANIGGSDVQILKLTVLKSGSNQSPVIVSQPVASANPTTVGTSVLFAAAATDADGDVLDYTWTWGDGTVGSGASVSKTFAAPGVYIVTVTATDGVASDSSSVNIVVDPAAGVFTVDKLSVTFYFVKPGKDTLSFSGKIPLPPGFSPAAKTVRVLVGGLDYTSTLTAKGATADRAFALKGKLSTTAKFTFVLKNRDLFAKLVSLGFSKTEPKIALDIPVIVVLDGNSHLGHVTIDYKVRLTKGVPQRGTGK